MLVTIWESDARQTEAFFEYAGYKARDMREPLRESASDFMDSVQDAFDTEGASVEGFRWPEVSAAWRRQKDKRGGTAELLLRFNDKLIEAATSGRSVHVTQTHMEYILRFPAYAAVHQFGWPGKNIPPRPYIAVNQELEEKVRQNFLWWLEETKAANARRSKIYTSPVLDNPVSGGLAGWGF